MVAYAIGLEPSRDLWSRVKVQLPEMYVNIGGVHLQNESKPLDKTISAFIDGAPDGVVLVSLGSSLNTNYLSEEIVNNILTAIGKLPQKVIMKIGKSGKSIKNLPSNVLGLEYFPQQDILAHPKIM